MNPLYGITAYLENETREDCGIVLQNPYGNELISHHPFSGSKWMGSNSKDRIYVLHGLITEGLDRNKPSRSISSLPVAVNFLEAQRLVNVNAPVVHFFKAVQSNIQNPCVMCWPCSPLRIQIPMKSPSFLSLSSIDATLATSTEVASLRSFLHSLKLEDFQSQFFLGHFTGVVDASLHNVRIYFSFSFETYF